MMRTIEQGKHLSVIVPVYNEEENIPLLHESLDRVLKELYGHNSYFRSEHLSEKGAMNVAPTTQCVGARNKELRPSCKELRPAYEVIYVDDGSTDATFLQLQYLSMADQHVRVVRLRRNFGQTAALSAGVAQSTGNVLVFMDGDLQNDPIDIPRLLAKLDEGYDVVSGWRKQRKDAGLSRKLPSQIANRLIAKVTGISLHDYGCTLKAYRREVFQHMRLYGEMHRFLPAYAALSGARITEIEVTHHARRFGVSKYGISRTVRVLLDLMTLKFLGSYGTKPMHAFGQVGIGSLLLGACSSTVLVGQHLLPVRMQKRHPLFLFLSFLFSGFGVQCLLLGLLAELLMRTYYESQGKSTYVVRAVLPSRNADEEELVGARSVVRLLAK